MLDQAFETLKTLDWGPDLKELNVISEAAVAAEGDARLELENRLGEMLKAGVTQAAKDFICRQLMVIGTDATVPILAEMLPQEADSHMARYALERIPAPQAAKALCDALPKVKGELKVGVICSLGKRQDADCVPALAALLGDDDAAVAQAAALALGALRSAAAAKALQTAGSVNPAAKPAATDATLACAEALLADGKKVEALTLYKSLIGGDPPKHVRLAATRGMLACAGKKDE